MVSENASSEAVQDLEFAWRQEERAWVRIDLMAALARRDGPVTSKNFISIAPRRGPRSVRGRHRGVVRPQGQPGRSGDR